jgi:hypothetical protein
MIGFRTSRGCGSIALTLLILYGWMAVCVPSVAHAAPAVNAHQQTNSEDGSSDCEQGKIDGENNSGGSPGYFFLGLACGLIGFIITIAQKPSPPAEDLVGKSDEYVVCYTSAYKKNTKKKNTTAACIGWGIGAAIGIAIVLGTAE